MRADSMTRRFVYWASVAAGLVFAIVPLPGWVDTARPDLAPEAAGLHAVSLGLSALAGDDDHGLLGRGFVVYDGLFGYLRFAACERHNWPAKAA